MHRVATHESYDSVLVGSGKQKNLESLSDGSQCQIRQICNFKMASIIRVIIVIGHATFMAVIKDLWILPASSVGVQHR